jgi:SAM-dependent methyltransferase
MLKFLQNNIYPRIETFRARLVRLIEPRIHNYRFYARAEKEIQTSDDISTVPFDIPIDHYYMGTFLAAETMSLKGEIIELTGRDETSSSVVTLMNRFLMEDTSAMRGRIRQTKLEELAHFPNHSCANIIANHVLNETADPRSVLAEMGRVLVPGGTILATLTTIAPPVRDEYSQIGFSPAATEYLFEKEFSGAAISITGYGNVLAGRMLLSGKGTGALTRNALNFVDPYFPLVSCVKVLSKKI